MLALRPVLAAVSDPETEHMAKIDGARMRAVSVGRWGGPPSVLKVVEVDRPVPGPVEILVRVHAAGVNPTDWWSRANGDEGLFGDPPILGYDVSGVVEEVGVGVALYRPGDEVFGMPLFPRQAGAYAQYVTAPPRHFAHKPAGLDHVSAAALPLAALTAWQALTETVEVRPGQRVLVHAAAGGVGHLAVQLAVFLGAQVIGTAREVHHAYLRGLGASELIDYTREDFAERLRNVDVVIDAVGADYAARSLRTMRRGGTLICLTDLPDEAELQLARQLGIRVCFTLVEPDHAGMKQIAALAESGDLRVRVGTVLPLEQAARAHEIGEAGRSNGKIVLRVN